MKTDYIGWMENQTIDGCRQLQQNWKSNNIWKSKYFFMLYLNFLKLSRCVKYSRLFQNVQKLLSLTTCLQKSQMLQ